MRSSSPILPGPLFFVGSARKDSRDFPEEVQDEIGHALQVVRWNGVPRGAKPLKGFGGVAVMEIVERHATNAYRAVYTARFADAVYVLNCFSFRRNRRAASPRCSRTSN